MAPEIASLSSLLALGAAEGNPRRGRGGRFVKGKGRRKGGRRRGHSNPRSHRRHGRRHGRRRGYRNPAAAGVFGRVGGGIKGVAKDYATEVVLGGLAAFGAAMAVRKISEILQPKIPVNIITGVGAYAAQAAVGIGATMLAKRFAGNKIAGAVAAGSAVLLGKRILDEQLAPRLGGALATVPPGTAEVYDTEPAFAGLGQSTPWERLPWGN